MSLQEFLADAIMFINDAVLPFILALAFVIFLFNVARYFIIQEEKRDEAKRTALWGILAFVVIASIWGITNLFVYNLDLHGDVAPCPDYNPSCHTEGNADDDPQSTWKPSDPTVQRCIIGISCRIVDGVRTCESCFLTGN